MTTKTKYKDPKKVFADSKYIIKYAFTVAGKDYYQFDDTHNIPSERGLTCILFYRELAMNCDYEFLKAHCLAVKNILDPNVNKGKIDIYKINQLNDLLIQRLRLPKDPELMYKLASVVFFDEDESPSVYEFPHNAEKIKFWKENAADTFFLQKPLQELIPFLQQFEESASTYLGMMQKINTSHLETISEHLSAEQKSTLKILNDLSPVETPQN